MSDCMKCGAVLTIEDPLAQICRQCQRITDLESENAQLRDRLEAAKRLADDLVAIKFSPPGTRARDTEPMKADIAKVREEG